VNVLPVQHPGATRRYVQGCALSVLVHVLAVGAAVALVADLRLVPQQEPFTWEVAVIETAGTPLPDQAQPIENPAQAQAAPAKPTAPPQTIAAPPVETRTKEPQQAAQAAPPAPSASVVSAPPPPRHETQEAKQEPQQDIKKEKPVVQTPPRPSEIEPRTAESLTASPAPVVAHETQRQASTPAAPQTTVQTAPAATQTLATVTPASPQPHVETARPAEASPHQVTAAVQPQTSAPTEQASAQEAPVRSASTTKTDYGWLAKALWSRVEQLKHYPQQARLNRWEGKVVLRAVIRDDGQLLDLSVVQSSGHEILDHDALEIMKRASPLSLHHPLGRPQVVVQVPISYKLEH